MIMIYSWIEVRVKGEGEGKGTHSHRAYREKSKLSFDILAISQVQIVTEIC